MKIKLIADRYTGTSGYTVGETYKIFCESKGDYFLYDDDGYLRYIDKSLKGNFFDWEITE